MRLWVVVLIGVLLAIAPFFAPYSEAFQDREHANEPPGHAHLMGTDELGRDIFSRFLCGGQLSLLGGALATFLALAIGIVIGSAAGMRGGWLDELLMRAAELFQSMPWLYLLLAVRALVPLELSARAAFWLVMLVIAASGWPRPARLLRGMVLTGKERGYVMAARAMGAGNGYLLRRHILPPLRGALLAQALVVLPQFMLADLSLHFLGLGAGEPAASWGGMLAFLRSLAALESHWGRLAPLALMIFFFIIMQWAASGVRRNTTM